MERWLGKTVVVTGASSGLGAAFVIDLVNTGLRVVALARRLDRLEELKTKVDYDNGGELHTIKCDVTVEQEIKDAFTWIDENFDGIHILVNNAGVMRDLNIIDNDNTESMRQVLDTNIMGVLLCTREAFQSMKARNIDGHIVIINSTAGHNVPFLGPQFPSLNIYPATKFAMTAVSEILRQEFQSQETNIKISNLSPGIVLTEIFSPAQIAAFGPNLKIMTAEDVSKALLFILSTPPDVQVHDLIVKPMGEKWL